MFLNRCFFICFVLGPFTEALFLFVCFHQFHWGLGGQVKEWSSSNCHAGNQSPFYISVLCRPFQHWFWALAKRLLGNGYKQKLKKCLLCKVVLSWYWQSFYHHLTEPELVSWKMVSPNIRPRESAIRKARRTEHFKEGMLKAMNSAERLSKRRIGKFIIFRGTELLVQLNKNHFISKMGTWNKV